MQFPPIEPPNGRIRPATGTEPLGRLAELAGWLAACQGQWPPRPLARCRLVLFGADHGVAMPGTADTVETTASRASGVLAGTSALNRIAELAGASIRVVDVGIDGRAAGASATGKLDPQPVALSETSAGDGAGRKDGRIDRHDALTPEQTVAAVAAGRAVADAEVDSGADLLIAGEFGVGAEIAALVLVAALTGAEPVAVVGLGADVSAVLDDGEWTRTVALVRDALRRARPVLTEPMALLGAVAGADLAALSGFLAQAAARRTPVLVDGVAVAAAALVAERLAPGARRWWLAAHGAAPAAHALALERLELPPLLALNLRVGAGTGALAALPLLRMAAEIQLEAVPVATTTDTAADDTG